MNVRCLAQSMTIDDRPTSFSWPSAIIWLIILIHICSSMCLCMCVCAIKVVTFFMEIPMRIIQLIQNLSLAMCRPIWYESEVVKKPHCNYIDWRTHTLYIVVLKLFIWKSACTRRIRTKNTTKMWKLACKSIFGERFKSLCGERVKRHLI